MPDAGAAPGALPRGNDGASSISFDLFSTPRMQIGAVSYRKVKITPITTVENAVANGASIDFQMVHQDQDMIDLNDMIVETTYHWQKDGADLGGADEDKVAAINYDSASLYKHVEVSLNNSQITDQEPTYHYKAFLQTLLFTSKDTQENYLTASGWYKDTATKHDTQTDANVGWKNRANIVNQAKSKKITTRGKLHTDLMMQGRCLVPGVEIRIRLHPASTQFFQMSGADGYQHVLDEVVLYVKYITPEAHVIENYTQRSLAREAFMYPVKRWRTTTRQIAQGHTGTYTIDNVFTGVLPEKLIVGMISNEAFLGNRAKNPYNFKNYGVKHAEFFFNNNRNPFEPYNADFSLFTGYSRAFQDTLEAFKWSNGQYPNLSRTEWGGGCTLWCIDNTSLGENLALVDATQTGCIRVDLTFPATTALAENVTVLFVGVWNNMISIDEMRNITDDFNA